MTPFTVSAPSSHLAEVTGASTAQLHFTKLHQKPFIDENLFAAIAATLLLIVYSPFCNSFLAQHCSAVMRVHFSDDILSSTHRKMLCIWTICSLLNLYVLLSNLGETSFNFIEWPQIHDQVPFLCITTPTHCSSSSQKKKKKQFPIHLITTVMTSRKF